MGLPVLIYGKSGSGKTSSLRNFGEDEIFYINVEKKTKPFRKHFHYEMASDDVHLICGQLAKMPCKTAVIDDATYIMSNNFMRQHSKPKQGASQFDMYNNIADNIWYMFEFIKKQLPDDVVVYMVFHEETDTNTGEVKILTIGKLLDQKVMLPGMVTIALRCMSENNEHFFKVTTDGSDITKTPIGMFDDAKNNNNGKIDNDLKAVDDEIRKYYEIPGAETKTKESEEKHNADAK